MGFACKDRAQAARTGVTGASGVARAHFQVESNVPFLFRLFCRVEVAANEAWCLCALCLLLSAPAGLKTPFPSGGGSSLPY